MTAILLLPLHASAALFAKQAASVHRLSDGRLTLGVAVGGREDDFDASGLPFKERGRRMDEMLDEIGRVWAGEERGFAGGIGPDVSDEPPTLILGGMADPVFRRAAEHGAGWIAGGGLPEYFVPGRDKVRAAFEEAGRSDRPRAMSLTYFSLAPDAEAQTRSTIGHYYAFLPQYADAVVELTAKGEDEVRERAQAFEEAGCDELIFFPSTADPDEVDRLAAAVL